MVLTQTQKILISLRKELTQATFQSRNLMDKAKKEFDYIGSKELEKHLTKIDDELESMLSIAQEHIDNDGYMARLVKNSYKLIDKDEEIDITRAITGLQIGKLTLERIYLDYERRRYPTAEKMNIVINPYKN